MKKNIIVNLLTILKNQFSQLIKFFCFCEILLKFLIPNKQNININILQQIIKNLIQNRKFFINENKQFSARNVLFQIFNLQKDFYQFIC